MTDCIQVLTTVGSEAEAERVAATEWRCLATTGRPTVRRSYPWWGTSGER